MPCEVNDTGVVFEHVKQSIQSAGRKGMRLVDYKDTESAPARI
jgi:hypothetical protein